MSGRAQHRAMGWLRASTILAGSIGLAVACGSAPEPPFAITAPPEGQGSAASTDGEVLDNRPEPVPSAEPDAGPPDDVDAQPMAPPAEAGAPVSEPSYYACTDSRLIGCDYIYVTLRDFAADLCVQLTLDNCNDDRERPLAVDVPLGWRLASGSALAGADECIPGEFYASSAPATDATGSIEWNLETRLPTELVIDVTLELSPAGDSLVPGTVSLSTDEIAGPLGECPS